MTTAIIKTDENASLLKWMERTFRKGVTKENTFRLFFVSLVKEEELIRKKDQSL